MLFENSKPETPETLTLLHTHFYSGNLSCFHRCECCQCAIVANTNVTNYQLDFGENVRNVGFVEGSEAKALLAKVFQRGADKVQFLVIDNQETIVECHACLD